MTDDQTSYESEADYEREAGLPQTASAGPISQELYIAERLSPFQDWYDTQSKKAKSMHLWMRTVAVVGGVLVPVLINSSWQFSKLVTTVVSLIVAVAISLESVYHYREQWKNYRSTEQLLGHERMYFQTKTGVYSGLDENEAFKVFVERVEDLIATENAATLNVMTHAAATTGADHVRS
ncbi:MAG TPA: DUF4231 domain-containing protein [Candidatus Limnocylindrales bacterium]